MEYIFISIIMTILYFGIYTPRPQKKYRTTANRKSMPQRMEEPKEIASRVKTQKDLDSLEEIIFSIESKIDEYQFDDNYREKISYETEQLKVLKKAIELAESNVYRYFYAYRVNTDTPLEELKLVGKLFTRQEHDDLIKKFDRYFVEVLLKDDEYFEKLKYNAKNFFHNHVTANEFKELFQFRKIIESGDCENVIKTNFNRMVSKSKYLKKELDLLNTDDNNLYEHYKQKLIQREKANKLYPCPSAKKFVESGYDTIDKIFTLSDEEILAIKGIGQKSLIKIRDYQKSR